jgi:hypothetical protein
MNNIERLSHHRGKGEIRQDAKAQLWNRLGSEFARCVPMKVLEADFRGNLEFPQKEGKPNEWLLLWLNVW